MSGSLSRWLKRAGWTALALVLLIAVLFGAIQTEPARRVMADWFAAELSEPGTMEISIGTVGGLLPFHVELGEIRIADRDGPWLTVERLALDVSPFLALGGRYRLSNLLVEAAALDRLPAAAEPDRTGALPLGFLAWPGELAIDGLTLSELHIGAAVAGAPVTLTGEGRVLPDWGDGARATLLLLASGGSDGFLDLDISSPRDDSDLVLSLALHEPDGGLLARYLELPGAPALALELSGEGDAKRWAGTLAGGFDRLASIDAGLTLVQEGPNLTLAIDGVAHAGALIDPRYRGLAAGPTTIDGAIVVGADERIVVRHAVLASHAARVDASGVIDAAAGAIDGVVRLAMDDLGPLRDGLDLDVEGRLAAELRWQGTAEDGHGAATIRLDEVRADEFTADRLSLEGTLDADGAGLRFDLTGAAEAPGPLPAPVSSLAGPRLGFAATGATDDGFETVVIDRLAVEGSEARLTADGRLDTSLARFDGLLRLALADLAGLAPGTLGAGQATITAALALELEPLAFEARLNGSAAELAFADAALGAVLGPSLEASAGLARGADGRITVSELVLHGTLATLTGNGALSPGANALAAELRLALDDLKSLGIPLGIDLAGQGALDIRLQGAPDDPDGSVRLATTDLAVAGQAMDGLAIHLDARSLVRAPSGQLRAEVRMSGLPVALTSRVALDGSVLTLESTVLDLGGGRLDGGLRLDIDDGLVAGRLAGGWDDLAPLAAALGRAGSGAATLALDLAAEDGMQSARLAVDAAALDLVEAGTALHAERLGVSATLTWTADGPAGRSRFDGEALTLDGVRLSRLAIDAEGNLHNLAFALEALGAGTPQGGLSGAGRLAIGPDGTLDVEFDRLAGRIADLDAVQAGPLRLVLGANRAEVAGLDLAIGNGRVSGDIAVGPETLDGALDARALPLAALRLLDPGLAVEEGRLSAAVTLTGSRAIPAGTVALAIEKLRIAGGENVPAASATLSGSWNDGRVALSGAVTGVPGTRFAMTLAGPLVLAPDRLDMSVPSDGAVALTLDGDGEIEPIAEFLLHNDDIVRGRFSIAITAGGTVAEPVLSGVATLADGYYENMAAGAVVTGLGARIEGQGTALTLTELRGGDGDGGTLEGGGRVAFGAEGAEIDIETRFEGMRLVRRDEATITASGTARLAQGARGPELVAAVRIDEAELRIPDRLGSAPRTIPVTEINRPAETPTAPPPAALSAPGSSDGALTLDVEIDMPRRIFVRGKGLDSEWMGRLTVRGSSAAPVIEGSIASVRGGVDLLGKSFTLDDSTIRFQGLSPPDPEFDASASTSTKELLARIRVTGRLSEPVIALESEPEMPEDEIIAFLLFGKSAGQISIVQAAQLANAAATLAGEGPDFMGEIRDILSVDTLTVSDDEGTDGAAGAALGVGKYVTDEVFISVQQGLTEQSGQVNVEVEVIPEVTLESEVGADAQSNIWLNWKKPY